MEHICQQYYTVSLFDGLDAGKNFFAPLFHVVAWSDADSDDVVLGSDNMLERGDEFIGQPTMGDQHNADHHAPFSFTFALSS